MDKQETYNSWLAEDFLLDEITRGLDVNEKLVMMYDYLRMMQDYDDEVENND